MIIGGLPRGISEWISDSVTEDDGSFLLIRISVDTKGFNALAEGCRYDRAAAAAIACFAGTGGM